MRLTGDFEYHSISVCHRNGLFSGQARADGELVPFITPPAGGGAYMLGAGISA